MLNRSWYRLLDFLNGRQGTGVNYITFRRVVSGGKSAFDACSFSLLIGHIGTSGLFMVMLLERRYHPAIGDRPLFFNNGRVWIIPEISRLFNVDYLSSTLFRLLFNS